MASLTSSLILAVVILAGLAASLSKDYDITVKVVKPNKLRSIIKSYSQTTLCRHKPAGLGRMVRGIDAAYLDLLPLETHSDMGFRSPIFDYTCNEGKKVFLDGKEYDLPDQISGAEPVPGGLKSTKVEIFRKLDQVINSMKLSVGIGDALGLFMLSPSLKFAHSTLTNTSRYMEEVKAHVSSFRADHAPSWVMELTKYAKIYLDRRLKSTTFNDSPEKYAEFIKTFGTHYFQDAFFGGMLKLLIETESSYFEKSTTVGVGLQAEGVFGEVVKLKGGVGVSNTNVDGNFKKSSKQSMRYYGGNLNLLDKAGMKDWMPTVMGNPWLFRGNLKPIYELIQDEGTKKEMKLAVQVHLDKAYLTYLRKMIESAVTATGANGETNKWMNMVKAESAKKIPDHNRLRSMGTQIEFQLFIPDWFRKNVEICFEWAPQPGFLHDGNQCAQHQGGLPRKLCTKLGSFTREYLDETDLRLGGCYYSWRLQIVGNPKEQIPSYFRNTKICHKWRAQGDAGQCNGNRRSGTNCAQVGQSTARYLDDTDWRGGGCEYAWMIQTPGNAPMWLKNLQLCMKWRATGDASQCGSGGLPANICTRSNQWSRAYKDDSSGKHGGCMMSWGMKN